MPTIAAAGQTIFASQINSIGLVGSIISTNTNGTVTSSTTETVDAVLGTLTFTALAARTYRVNLIGRGINGSVVGDRFSVKFRYTVDGSTPTAASTLIDHDTTSVTAASVFSFVHQALFVPGAATVKVVVSFQRLSGTGTATPSGQCQFFAEAL